MISKIDNHKREEVSDEKDIKDMPVLLICGQSATRLTIGRYLEGQGYLIHTAKSGKEGIEMDQDHISQLIIADSTLPDTNLTECLTTIRENRRLIRDVLDIGAVPVVLMLGAHERIERSMLKANSVIDCLRKPLNLGKIGQSVEKVLRGELKLPEEPRMNICILDPEKRALNYFSRLLQAEDVTVHPVADEFNLTLTLSDTKVDVFVIELLAVDDPVKYVSDLCKGNPHAEIIICTALHDDDLHREIRGLGVEHIITKPVDPVKLRKIVRTVLANHES